MGLARYVFPGPVAVIGDVHGCAGALRELLGQLDGLPVVVLGDVGDRGPDTRGVIDLLLERKAVGVRGNHDDWLLAWASGEGLDDFALHEIMGGQATLDCYGVTGRTAAAIEAERWRFPGAHREFLASLADAIDLEVAGKRYWLAHGGVVGKPERLTLAPEDIVPWYARNRPRDLRTLRLLPRHVPDLGRLLIVGHTPSLRPVVEARVVGIDTGAGTLDDGALTAVVLPTMRLVSVPAPA